MNDLHTPNSIRSGLVTTTAYESVLLGDWFAQLESFSNAWLASHQRALAPYARAWVADPLHQWSRQWEYPYVASHLTDGSRPRVLDAGSGVTFFPYFLQESLGAEVVCCDQDATLAPLFAAINADANRPVQFTVAGLHELPYDDGVFDAVGCISVLEHTDNYRAILREFARVLVPGGRMVMTFDICLDGQAQISPEGAEDLLAAAAEVFPGGGSVDLRASLTDSDLFTTDYVRQRWPALLPWRHLTIRQALQMLRWRRWPRRRFVKLACCGVSLAKPHHELLMTEARLSANMPERH